MPMIRLDDCSDLDGAAVLALNNQHASETSPLDQASLAVLLAGAFYARGFERGSTGFLIALDQLAVYASPNFVWFQQRGGAFVYVDRVIVASAARGQGLATLLYEDLFAAAKISGHHRVVCEVNLEPPNPVSVAFHVAMGFATVGEATIYEGTKTVRYYEKKL